MILWLPCVLKMMYCGGAVAGGWRVANWSSTSMVAVREILSTLELELVIYSPAYMTREGNQKMRLTAGRGATKLKSKIGLLIKPSENSTCGNGRPIRSRRRFRAISSQRDIHRLITVLLALLWLFMKLLVVHQVMNY